MSKKKKRKKAKVDSVTVRRAKQGFVVESYDNEFGERETNIATSLPGVNKLVNSLIDK